MISRILQIQEYYKNKGINTIRAFCDKFGFDATNWSKYLKNEKNICLTENIVRKLKGEGISVEWVRTGNGSMFYDTQCVVVLPVYNIRTTGNSAENTDDILDFVENIAFDSKLFSASLKPELEKCKIIIASGHSMEDEIFDGDYVLYKPQNFLGKEGIYIINVGGNLIIKTAVYDRIKEQLTLISKNQSYPSQSYTGQEQKKISPIGKVIAVLHKYENRISG